MRWVGGSDPIPTSPGLSPPWDREGKVIAFIPDAISPSPPFRGEKGWDEVGGGGNSSNPP